MFKAIGGRHFSFMVFGGAQVLMDLEPLFGILLDWPILHGRTHSFVGATAIGLVAALTGRPLSLPVLRWLRVPHPPFTWTASFLAAFAGTYSHVVLDAIMHADSEPLWPFAPGNPWLSAVSMEILHLGCFASAAVGLAGIGLHALWTRRLRKGTP
ncbi:hypothetical protein P873_13225 [Arenimonas composti TR7-09 = DSM 18010]|uniref:Hydrolase n=1 Tax=Arenimonas composti TR7-09 = DSM 18010 TaxID=1121013 RepID=A0A091B8D9_9GAMM|nr:hypothetical protein P873_13225 [Arenimonas composti TR7-09 = DSM 18010]